MLFATHYQHLVFFAHALEILLHTVVESEATLGTESDTNDVEADTVLSTVVEFLDYFDAAPDVVVGCARKTEMTRWKKLFNIVGNPKALFEVCAFPYKVSVLDQPLLDMLIIPSSQNGWVLPTGVA